MNDNPGFIREYAPGVLLVNEAYLRKLQAVAATAKECADMLVFSEDERTFGQVAARAMEVRSKLRDALATGSDAEGGEG